MSPPPPAEALPTCACIVEATDAITEDFAKATATVLAELETVKAQNAQLLAGFNELKEALVASSSPSSPPPSPPPPSPPPPSPPPRRNGAT